MILRRHGIRRLNVALQAKVSILDLYRALSNYLDMTQEQQRGLLLGEAVLEQLKVYPPETLAGPVGAEFCVVIDDIAKCQLLLKRYGEAEASYQEALAVLDRQQAVAQETKEKGRAGILHQLGMVAQAQRQWGPAEQYYQQALAIYVEFNDRYEQAGTLGQLGLLAEAQEQFRQAYDYLLQALTIFAEHKDDYSVGIALQSLARLWQASGDATLPTAMAEVLQVTVEEMEGLLRKVLGEKE